MIKSRNIILILTAVVIVAAIAYFAGQTPAKNTNQNDGPKITPVSIPATVVAAGAVIAGANSAAASTPGQETTIVAMTNPTSTPEQGQETTTVEIPTDTFVVSYGLSYELTKFKPDEFPKNIFVANRHTLFRNIKITDTAITGEAINSDLTKNDGDTANLGLRFWKDGKEIGGIDVFRLALGSNHQQKMFFETPRKPETLNADMVTLDLN